MAYRETEKMRSRKAQARKRILDCAFMRVAEGGFRNARISHVARAAGVATGTIYRHFESKEELFAEIFRLATQREMNKVAEALATSDDVVTRLEKALTQFAERALRGPTMAWSLIAEPVDPRVEAERLMYREAYAEHFQKAIKQGIEEGTLPNQNARQSSTCLVGAIAESLVGPLSPAQSDGSQQAPEPEAQRQLVESIVRFCIQGLTGIRR
ncbi:TetR/AcrR family transcriptional regulator [Marinobacter sp.]|uniref:TetR/AcrR family transcriptional regulator n=1 Tax=Marinobacter sp. TaxID=50741 RepID=UPI00384F8729